MRCNHCTHESSCITTVPVFRGLSEAEILPLRKVTHSRSFPKGAFIFREGEHSDTLFLVQEGLIKLTKTSAEGKEQIVRLLFPGDFFGLFSLLRNEKQYANAEAVRSTVICAIDKTDFLKTIENHSGLSFRFLKAVNDRLYEADESVGNLSLLAVEQRLARALILFYEKIGEPLQTAFTLPISKKDLASFIGTTPESVSRKLLYLMSQKFIRLDGTKRVEILEMSLLKELAGLES